MKDKIENLRHGEHYIVPESDYGKAEIWRLNDVYVLFDIPLFDGEPNYVNTFSSVEIEQMIYTIINLT